MAAVLLAIPVGAIAADDFQKTSSAGIEGAIIPAETLRKWRDVQRDHDIQNMLGIKAEEFWTPSAQDVSSLERRLKPTLEKGEKEPATLSDRPETLRDQKWLSEQVGRILSHYGDYRRQYLGLVIGGKRHIFVNSFAARDAENYTKNYVVVFDGGFWFWHTLYSVEDHRFLWLGVNGEA